MTNLEFYKDEIKRHIKNNTPSLSLKSDVIGDAFRLFAYERIGLWLNDEWFESQHFIDWLLAEHKEPIKLTKFEYDLLKCYQETKDDGEFVDHYILTEMQYKGHFQNVDYNLTIEEILENCEVIDK